MPASSISRERTTNFTHPNLFTGLDKHYCICEKNCTKPFVAPETTSVGGENYKFANEKNGGNPLLMSA